MSNTKEYYWLNSHSRLFLERGYLEEGVSPEERIKQIADNAEKILKIKGFSAKFQDYMSRGLYSLSTPVWTNFGNKRGLPVSCVVGETWINTRLAGGKMAKDIQIGDEVLTHKGRYKKVLDIIKTKKRKNIYKLKVANRMTPLYLTGDHLVLTNLGWVKTEELDALKHLVAINGDCEYVENDYSIDLKPFCDYEPCVVDGKIHKKIVENKKYKKRSKNGKYVAYFSNPCEIISVDEDLAWALGFWFAEGSLSSRKGKPSGIRVTYNDKDEKPLGEAWFSIISQKFNLKGSITSASYKRNGKIASWCNANINSNVIGKFFESFGKGCKDKIIPQWIIDLPKNKLQSFINGLLEGDGFVTKSKGNRITVANPKMLMQIYQIGLKLGYEMSLQMQQKAGKLSTTKYVYTCFFKKYNISCGKKRSGTAIKFYDGLYYSPINQISLTDRVEDVYDFTVEHDHSFSAAGVILHNCFGSLIMDRMECILDKASEVGMMSKLGGGTSGYFGDLRERGAKISVGGESSGAVHFMEIYDKVANVISQGSARRGSFAAYLPIEHADIEEFLQIRSEGHPIQNMSIGVTVTDKFMKEMIGGDKDKRKIWAKVIQKRFETGYPYIMFVDNVNKHAPQVYKDKKLKIKASNLCVAPETKILTKDGCLTIGENENKEIEVWNGKEWSKTKIIKTGTSQKLISLTISKRNYLINQLAQDIEFIVLNTTEYHKFYLENGKEVEASSLKEGDKLLNFVDEKGTSYSCEVLSVIDEGRLDDTYCVNEPLEHKAVFNGILTGNCSEINLFSDEENSFVCVLSSLNLLHWEEIKETDAVETLIYFLDAVNEEFVVKTENVKFMEAAHNFAKSQRALGMGILGWHSLLQSKMIAFESMQAKLLNTEIWKTIRQRADKATEELAVKFGEPELLKGYGRRNVTTLAVAPTTSSSFILGQVSPSIEPLNSNYFVKNLAKGKFTYKNPYLKEVLKKYDKNNDDVWKSILVKGGSVQHLDFLSKEEKDVFKTFGEISQKEIVIQAAQRQKYIDQAQSLNLMIPPNTSPKEVNSLLIEGWELGVKTFYYQRSANPAQELARSILTCSSCES